MICYPLAKANGNEKKSILFTSDPEESSLPSALADG